MGADQSSTTKNKSGNIWKVFVCSKQGYRKPRKSPPQSAIALANAISRARENERRVKQRRVETREGCNARIVMSSMIDGQFEVCTFHAGHVHPLVTPSRRQFLRSSRNISSIHKDFICKYGRANVGASKSLKEIPACFEVDRWTKLAAKKPIFELDTIVSTSYAQVG
ncbi:LOW QUALITY PROTEIN: hypothetical protein Cgig2_009481 [Carnegiea gigantea]|uniref:FAR1 domain-containing protein n=1 Tax=Carnegiea gigantea TaxID=171969 RepID=A0A9Q1GM42_9CARY|nr:LOW QUALITY PROTEIN: hypothetical protein Cgig2_009481 [Carnegiea gigantea]